MIAVRYRRLLGVVHCRRRVVLLHLPNEMLYWFGSGQRKRERGERERGREREGEGERERERERGREREREIARACFETSSRTSS